MLHPMHRPAHTESLFPSYPYISKYRGDSYSHAPHDVVQ